MIGRDVAVDVTSLAFLLNPFILLRASEANLVARRKLPSLGPSRRRDGRTGGRASIPRAEFRGR